MLYLVTESAVLKQWNSWKLSLSTSSESAAISNSGPDRYRSKQNVSQHIYLNTYKHFHTYAHWSLLSLTSSNARLLYGTILGDSHHSWFVTVKVLTTGRKRLQIFLLLLTCFHLKISECVKHSMDCPFWPSRVALKSCCLNKDLPLGWNWIPNMTRRSSILVLQEHVDGHFNITTAYFQHLLCSFLWCSYENGCWIGTKEKSVTLYYNFFS